jgi:hypothetical protein
MTQRHTTEWQGMGGSKRLHPRLPRGISRHAHSQPLTEMMTEDAMFAS